MKQFRTNCRTRTTALATPEQRDGVPGSTLSSFNLQLFPRIPHSEPRHSERALRRQKRACHPPIVTKILTSHHYTYSHRFLNRAPRSSSAPARRSPGVDGLVAPEPWRRRVSGSQSQPSRLVKPGQTKKLCGPLAPRPFPLNSQLPPFRLKLWPRIPMGVWDASRSAPASAPRAAAWGLVFFDLRPKL